MYDQKRISIDFPTPLHLLLTRHYLWRDPIFVGRLVEDIMVLSDKLTFDVNNGVTPEDLLHLYKNSGLPLNNKQLLSEFVIEISATIAILLGVMATHGLVGSVRYVSYLTDYQIIIESYRI